MDTRSHTPRTFPTPNPLQAHAYASPQAVDAPARSPQTYSPPQTHPAISRRPCRTSMRGRKQDGFPRLLPQPSSRKCPIIPPRSSSLPQRQLHVLHSHSLRPRPSRSTPPPCLLPPPFSLTEWSVNSDQSSRSKSSPPYDLVVQHAATASRGSIS